MRSIITLQQSKGVSVEETRFDSTVREKLSQPIPAQTFAPNLSTRDREATENAPHDSLREVDRVLSESSFEENRAKSAVIPDKSLSADSLPHETASSDSLMPQPLTLSESSQALERNSRSGSEPILSPSSVAVYRPGGEVRGKNSYYRLEWWENSRPRYKHIRGGNTGSPAANARVARIKDAIATGQPLAEILDLC